MSNRKFILSSTELGRVTLADDPIGWDTVKKTYSRNLKFAGIFRKRTSALKFWGDGLAYCVELERLKGTEAILNVTVMQKKDYEDAWILEYEGIGKFNPFDLEWDNDLRPVLTIEFEDSGFHNKFLTRVATVVNVGDVTSIESLALGSMPTEDIQVHQRTIQENNNFSMSVNNKYYGAPSFPDPEYIKADFGHLIPAEKISGETEFIQTPVDYLVESPGLMCAFLLQDAAFKIKTVVEATGHVKIGLSGLAAVRFYIREYTDSSDLTIVTNHLLHTESLSGASDEVVDFSISFDVLSELNIPVNHAFSIVMEARLSGGELAIYDILYTVCNVDISLIQDFKEYVSKCHYRHEFMKRLAQIITDQEDSFKSNIFGRTDIGYVTNGAYYNNVVFNGKQIRGFDEFASWSFEKCFKSVRSIWNLGCGIEKIDGKFKVVVEDLPYFYRGDISITLHNVRKVKRGVNEDFTFSEVRVGYEKAEYEQVNGLEEYNNKSTFATFIKSNTNVLDLISPERTDGYGMEFARRKSALVAATEDTPYDQEVFTAMVRKDGTILKTEKDENYDSVVGIMASDTATNLDITPQRNLIRNGDWVKGCVNKYPDELLKFVSADKETDLVSTRTGEAAVTEQSSILNSALRSSLWLNKNYLFEADITPDQVATMELKPNSLIKFSPFNRAQTRKYYYGWILDISVGGKERNGTFTLLAANINSDRLKIIDPDGIDFTDIPPQIPGEEFGFEYAFEHAFES